MGLGEGRKVLMCASGRLGQAGLVSSGEETSQDVYVCGGPQLRGPGTGSLEKKNIRAMQCGLCHL